jgi:hypothetical protein
MLNTSLVFVEGKRKYLFLSDHTGAPLCLPLIQSALERKLPLEWQVHDSCEESELIRWLSSQPIGSFLYLAGSRQVLESARNAAHRAGYSDEELQAVLVGDETTRIFCVVCEQLALVPHGRSVTCPHCATALSVTDHYSPRLQAYLAYQPIST